MRYPNIEAERARRGMSKREFAALLGMSYDKFRRWQNGRSDISSVQLIQLAQTWNLSIDYLVGWTPDDRPQESARR